MAKGIVYKIKLSTIFYKLYSTLSKYLKKKCVGHVLLALSRNMRKIIFFNASTILRILMIHLGQNIQEWTK